MELNVVYVLSIEDNPGDARLIQAKLSSAQQVGWGLPRFEIIWVDRLAKGLVRLDVAAAGQGEPIDVVLTDLDLPDSQAGETFAALRSHFPHMPIVVLTGRDDEELARKSVRAGAQDYLFKAEATGSLLAHALIYAIERQQTKQALQQAHDELERRVAERTAELAESERLLRQTYEQFEKVMTHSPALISLLDAEGRYLLVNRAMTEFYGLSRAEIEGKTVTDLLPVEVANLFIERVQRVFETKASYDVDDRLSADGEVYVYATTLFPILDNDGEPYAVGGIANDVTERIRAEDALHESEERLSLALQGTGVGLWDWQVQTGETVFDERWAAIVGYTLEELSPVSFDTWIELVHPDDLEKSSRLLNQHFAGETDHYECEVRMKHKEGFWVWVLDQGKVFEWDDEGRPVRMAGTHMDITERKEMESKLRRERNFAESLIETAQAIVLVLDTEGRIVRFNPYMEAISGYRLEEVQGQDWFSTFLPESERDYIRELFLQAIGDIQTRGNITAILTKDGRMCEIMWYDKVLRDAEGHVSGLLAIGYDIPSGSS